MLNVYTNEIFIRKQINNTSEWVWWNKISSNFLETPEVNSRWSSDKWNQSMAGHSTLTWLCCAVPADLGEDGFETTASLTV